MTSTPEIMIRLVLPDGIKTSSPLDSRMRIAFTRARKGYTPGLAGDQTNA
jgi:hypothetical protein